MSYKIKDIKPKTPTTSLDREGLIASNLKFPIDQVTMVTSMSSTFIRKALGHSSKTIDARELLKLLDLDAFSETFVPRSMVPQFLSRANAVTPETLALTDVTLVDLPPGNALTLM